MAYFHPLVTFVRYQFGIHLHEFCRTMNECTTKHIHGKLKTNKIKKMYSKFQYVKHDHVDLLKQKHYVRVKSISDLIFFSFSCSAFHLFIGRHVALNTNHNKTN